MQFQYDYTIFPVKTHHFRVNSVVVPSNFPASFWIFPKMGGSGEKSEGAKASLGRCDKNHGNTQIISVSIS